MSKKKFTSGLESLFTDTGKQDTFLDDNSSLMTEEYQDDAIVEAKVVQKKTTGKNFSSSLNRILEAPQTTTSFESFVEDANQSAAKMSQIKKPMIKPLTGLDALIRQTIGDINYEHSNLKKRVTVVLDQSKIEKLRAIAKSESAYVKDVIENVIDQYIKTYDTASI